MHNLNSYRSLGAVSPNACQAVRPRLLHSTLTLVLCQKPSCFFYVPQHSPHAPLLIRDWEARVLDLVAIRQYLQGRLVDELGWWRRKGKPTGRVKLGR